LPGSKEPLQSSEDAERMAAEVGYPVILKAAAGGGRARHADRLEEKRSPASSPPRAAKPEKAFGDGFHLSGRSTWCSRRHIEFQVFGDLPRPRHPPGRARCSIQRRHQKLIEEVPSPALTPALREEMGAAAVALCGRWYETPAPSSSCSTATAASISWR